MLLWPRLKIVTGLTAIAYALILATGCVNADKAAKAAANPAATGGGAAGNGVPFHRLLETLTWCGVFGLPFGILLAIAGAVLGIKLLVRGGAVIAAAAAGCLALEGVIEYLGGWIMWAAVGAIALLAFPAALALYIKIERWAGVDAWPGPGIGPNGEQLER